MPMSCFMILLLATYCASSHRVADQDWNALQHQLPQKGDKCDDKSPSACADGLKCSPSSKTCKVAIMQPCNRTWKDAWGKSECAGKDIYDRDIMCSEPDSVGRSFCCIKGKKPMISPHKQQTRAVLHLFQNGKDCCSGESKIFIKDKREYSWEKKGYTGKLKATTLCL